MRVSSAQKVWTASTALLFSAGLFVGHARSETLDSALARAYMGNPTLNAQRAAVRATDEGVPAALSGYRPRLTASGDIGAQYNESVTPGIGNRNDQLLPRGGGLTIDQTIWNGNRTENRVKGAETSVLAARETLRNSEQQVLLDAATSYMNVLRDTAILNLRRNNIEVIEEQLRQVRDRFNVGELTRTDVAQAESRLALSRSQASLAEANLKASIARYRQNVGTEPKQLAPGKPLEKSMPKSLPLALQTGMAEHPAIQAALHGVDVAVLNVKTIEGELYPTLSVQGSLQKRYDSQSANDQRLSASVVGRLSVPLYEGGEVYARTRQAKETLGQRRIEADVQRDLIRANIVASWGNLEAVKAQTLAAQAQVQAAEVALNGVREEAKVGQRTTLDVLNSQQELLDARVNLITAQRDRVVASYTLLNTIGRLSAKTLGLKVTHYDSRVHYDQVRDKWGGLRTPDGR
jgi:outer membrane protein